MNAILRLARREVQALFLSPLAWTLLAVLFALCAYMFGAAVELYLARQMQFRAMGGGDLPLTAMTVAPLYGNAAVLMLLILPLFTMRLIAEEKRRDTWPALLSSPLSSTQIILGKYLGLLAFLAATLALLGLLPLTLTAFGNPDMGMVLGGLLGLFLLCAAFGAVGLATSSIGDNPIVSALLGFGALLALWILAWAGQMGDAPDSLLEQLSLMTHFEPFLRGLVRSGDLYYFLALSTLGLLFARHRLEADRIRG
ncbi:MAG: ABC transporter permease [Magnetococcus sp. WYHC-3]